MKDTIESIVSYLRGYKLPMRADDPRQWADYLEQEILPKLEELERVAVKKKAKGDA